MIEELKKIEPREIMPGFWGRFVHTDNMTFAYWEIKKGSSLPEHSHMHEQVVNMLEGEFELVLEGTSNHLRSGMVLPIPSNARHSGRAITDCKILDVFYPVREDYKK
ncbi:MAG: cupin domain-containing protein [Cytophagales bacterium]|jgi:quercetin dioxygenase-like cupin family protein|nr:cupin domain-containing protein [Cytophagales bacterium]MCA6387856.1 cupin domain-containing protein [Cytophagales bacterium]MCA6391414.1 cupin domain-containing protein [Cytophagales bacterium]MCA6394409.1 cupin domain-containing protein [Cytophagales bacterium]MCA6398399.1 cupin domain-containing protein [Cytophagales bacterium]